MEIVILLVFVSLVLVVLGLSFFVWCVRSKTLEHSDRLALLPVTESEEESSSSLSTSRRQ